MSLKIPQIQKLWIFSNYIHKSNELIFLNFLLFRKYSEQKQSHLPSRNIMMNVLPFPYALLNIYTYALSIFPPIL